MTGTSDKVVTKPLGPLNGSGVIFTVYVTPMLVVMSSVVVDVVNDPFPK